MPFLAVQAQPKVNVQDGVKDVGKVTKGEMVHQQYEVVNEGDQPLFFSRYDVACSCTTADLPAEPVLPGQSAIINVHFNTSSAIGRQDRTIELFSNDPNGPYRIRLKCNVVKD